MLDYFPFGDDTFKMSLGAQALAVENLLEIDRPRYQAEIALKSEILASDYPYYFQAAPATEPMQWETLELLLPALARRYPALFALSVEDRSWRWRNALLNSATVFVPGDPASLPLPPLDWLGRQVQEDLLLLDGQAPGIPLVGGQLCFANAWCLNDKLGQSFLAIHDPVPLFASQIGRSSLLLMERLKPGRAVWRLNWAVKPTGQLDLSSRFEADVAALKPGITVRNAGERCYLRVERQGLLRLPRSGGILFTIHTYQMALAELVQNKTQARLFLGVLKSAPPGTLDYKGITPFIQPLLSYLETNCT